MSYHIGTGDSLPGNKAAGAWRAEVHVYSPILPHILMLIVLARIKSEVFFQLRKDRSPGFRILKNKYEYVYEK